MLLTECKMQKYTMELEITFSLLQATSSPKSGARRIQVGFPPLFVCMVALISLMIGIFYRA